MVKKPGYGNIERFTHHIEIDPDAVGPASPEKVLIDFTQMEFTAKVGGKFLQHGDIAMFTDQSVHALAQAGRQFGAINLDTGYRYAFDRVAPIDVGFGGRAVQFLIGKEASAYYGGTERQRQEQGQRRQS